MFEEEKSLAREVLLRIQKIGRVEERLNEIISNELFDDLSKHNPYWHSTDESASDKLHEIRMKLSFIHDKISDAYQILKYDDE